MIDRSKIQVFLPLALLMLLLAVGACNDNNPTAPGDDGADDTIDINGEWAIEEAVDATACGEGISQENYTATVVQDGNSFTITTPFGSFNGTISGTSISWNGSYQADGGTTTIDAQGLSVSADGTSITGSVSWTRVPDNGGPSCSGTSAVSGATIPPVSSGVTGAWTITEDVNATACDIDDYTDVYNIAVQQNGSAITVTAPAGVFSGTINGTALNWSGSYADDGGTVTTQISVTVSANGSALSGSSTWTWVQDDGQADCSGSTQISGVKN